MTLRCECGYEARGESEEQLVAAVQRHAWDAHGMTLSLDDARRLATRAADPHARDRTVRGRRGK
jgi:predicted small metal-binding protein